MSNVALCNPVTQKADRVGVRVLEDGRKVRFFKSNGELVERVKERPWPASRKSTRRTSCPR